MPTPLNFATTYEQFQDFTPEQIILIHRMYEFNNLNIAQADNIENAALRNDFLDGIETLTYQGLLPGSLPNPLTDSEQTERIQLVRERSGQAGSANNGARAALGSLRNLYLEPTDGFINAYSNLSDDQRAQLLQNASDAIDSNPELRGEISDDALETTRAAANPQEAEPLEGDDAVNFFLAREQAVLSSLTERILTEKLSLEQTNQENIIQVTDENAALLVNHIQKRQSLLDFFRIRTPNLSLIVPRIRLYKVLYEEGSSEEVGRFEFIFNSFTSEDKISQITETKFGRGEGSGIKSVTWDYEGTNPETVRSFVNFNLSLFLQNLSDLFDSNLGEEVFKIEDNVDLIQLIGAGVGVERENGSRFNYNIRAELGWTISSHISSDLCSDQTIEDLREIIEQVSTPIELSLKEHQINFNNDGTLTLDLTYFAAIDEIMTDNSMNVLAIGGLEGIASVQAAREQEAEEAAADARSTLGGERDPTVDNCSPTRRTDRAALEAQGDEEDPTITETEVLSSLAAEGEQNILNNYNELFNRLTNGGNIYRLEFNSADLAEAVRETNWDWLAGIAGGSLSISSELLTVAVLQELRRITLQVRIPPGFIRDQNQNAIGDTQINNARTQARRDNVDAGELIDDVFSDENLREALNRRVSNRLAASDDGKYEIDFIRLGDLLDTVIEGLKEIPGSALNRQQNNLNFISSLYYYRDAIDGSRKAYNYCNMLITIDSFRQFFVEKIVKDLKTVYSLKNFIIDLINKFSYVESLKVQTTRTFVAAEGRPAFTVFQGPDVGLQTAAQLQAIGEGSSFLDVPIPSLEAVRRRNIVTDVVGLNRRLNTFEVSTNLTNYFIIHSTSFAVIGEGKEEEDIARGIYHITVGADKGILKNVSFRRDEIAGRREGRIVNAGGLNLSALREKYDVTITTFGAPFFFPGMYFYLNPNMVGMGRPSADFSAANILGLGGYYFINKVSNSISEDMRFETTLEASWNSDGSGLGPDGCEVGMLIIVEPFPETVGPVAGATTDEISEQQDINRQELRLEIEEEFPVASGADPSGLGIVPTY